jgi:hypothetical protein
MYEVRGENGPHSGELNPTNGWGNSHSINAAALPPVSSS